MLSHFFHFISFFIDVFIFVCPSLCEKQSQLKEKNFEKTFDWHHSHHPHPKESSQAKPFPGDTLLLVIFRIKMKAKIIILVAFFVDVLQSFSPCSRSSKGNSLVLKVSERDITYTLPSFNTTSDFNYPSPLHQIHIRSLMSAEEAKTCCKLSNEFASSTGRWNAPDSNRHASYATCDFPVEDCESLESYLNEIGFHDRLWEQLGDLYTLEKEDLSYLDLFVAHYEVKTDTDDTNIMDRLELHRDGTLLSFSLLLNSEDDFTGGGTFYDALRDVTPSGILHSGGVIRPKQGDAVLHCGKILHGADVVTGGQRTVLVGFVEVAERCTKKGSLAKACTDFGRMDVAAKRLKRQAKKNHQGWKLQNGKFLTGYSHVKGYTPAFESVVRRGNEEYQRQKKLLAEDNLLRSILLPEEERENNPMWEEITLI